MTNEEIRIKVPMLYNDLGDDKECIIAGYSDINQIQNLTRADERDKVIGEIKEIWKKEIFGRYRGVDFVLNEIFLTKLNSLREAK